MSKPTQNFHCDGFINNVVYDDQNNNINKFSCDGLGGGNMDILFSPYPLGLLKLILYKFVLYE